MVGIAYGAATGLAQPDAALGAVAKRALHGVGAPRTRRVEARARNLLEGRLGAGGAETSMTLAEGARRWRLGCAVLCISWSAG